MSMTYCGIFACDVLVDCQLLICDLDEFSFVTKASSQNQNNFMVQRKNCNKSQRKMFL